MEFPFEGTVLSSGVAFNAWKGIGCEAIDHDIEETRVVYAGMKPSTFLALSTPLAVPRDSLYWLEERLQEKCEFAPSTLHIRMSNHSTGVPCVLSHDGRHRMSLFQSHLNDVEIPVRLVLFNCKDDTGHCLQNIQVSMRTQKIGKLLLGPFFTEAQVQFEN